jgi:HD-like signal output (HDOD) protein
LLALELHDRLLDLSEALRPLPATVIELAQAVASEGVSVPQVAQIVSKDPGLVAPLLSEANSAASASVTEITTVDRAVSRLGIARVLAIATSSAMHGVVPDQLPGYDLAGDTLWGHAQLSSRVAEVLRRVSPMEIGPEIVTAALLHDLGKVIMGQVLVYRHLDQARLHAGDLVAAERELVSLDHAEVGAILLEIWKLPASICEPVRYHHAPHEGGGLSAHALHIADVAAWAKVNPEEHVMTPVAENSLRELGLTFDQVMEAIDRELERTAGS